jgi:hypothetical protein
METIEQIDGMEPFPGHISLFLAALNARMEDLEPRERKAYLSIRYEMDIYQKAEDAIGRDAVEGKRNMLVKTGESLYECEFMKRKTRSSRDSNLYRHELIARIASEKACQRKVKPDRTPGKPVFNILSESAYENDFE